MKINLRSRLEKLESRAVDRAVVLTMADGRQIRIPVRRSRDILKLYCRVLDDPNCPDAVAIKEAVQITEPSGHVIEMAAAVLRSPKGPETIQ